MSNTPLSVALVGCGFMGSMHAQIYSQLPGARVVAAADRDPAGAAAKLAKLGWTVPTYPTLRELLARHPEVQIVDVCTPADAHDSDAVVALNAGKHLFCEKPLAPNLAAADRILAAAKQSGTFAQVGHCIRFWPEYQALRAFHQAGKAGKLLSLSMVRRAGRPGYSDQNWLNQPGRSGGAALDLHIHDSDFAIALLGEPRGVTSRGTFDYSGPAHIFTIYDYPDIAVTAEGGWNYPADWGFRMAFQALYEQACVDYDSATSPTLTVTWAGKPKEPLAFSAPSTGESRSGEGNISSLGGYFNELQSFVADIRAGRAPQDATLADARRSLALALAEIESARAGRAVTLPFTP
jgi:predicted dehydrogenase